ncbi:DUF4932 domain-containing protein [Candidatus Latescibacterota bacterium]
MVSRKTLFLDTIHVFTLFLLILSCITAPLSAEELKPVTIKNGELTISVDPRIELLSVIQSLTDYRGFQGRPVLGKLDFGYKHEIAAVFGKYSGHPAPKKFHEMSQNGFWYSHPVRAMLHLSNPPALAQDVQFDDFAFMTAGGEENLNVFVEKVRAFARETNFSEFYNGHIELYETMLANYRGKMKRAYVDDLEEYYGFAQGSYTIILSPLFHPGGFGPTIRRPNGMIDSYYIGGPRQIVDDIPDYGEDKNMQYLFWHEFSHSFVNHLTDLNIADFREPGIKLYVMPNIENAPNFEGQEDVMISDWVSEHIVRGVTSRLAYINLGKKTGDERVAFEIGQGFKYVAEVTACLEKYEQNRDKYPTLREFYPEIVSVFEELATDNR